MVEYSVDTNPRVRMYFVLAGLSVVGACFLALSPALAAYRFATPSAFILYGALLWAFNRYLWRVPLIRALGGIPYLGGTRRASRKAAVRSVRLLLDARSLARHHFPARRDHHLGRDATLQTRRLPNAEGPRLAWETILAKSFLRPRGPHPAASSTTPWSTCT